MTASTDLTPREITTEIAYVERERQRVSRHSPRWVTLGLRLDQLRAALHAPTFAEQIGEAYVNPDPYEPRCENGCDEGMPACSNCVGGGR